jgi:hypothetical protein
MTENVENLILEHLKRFQSSLDRVERDIREVKTRLGTLEGGQAAIMQHLTHLSALRHKVDVNVKRFSGAQNENPRPRKAGH